MLSGRWTQQNRIALEDLLAEKPRERQIAVFDWDNTCVAGDIADAVFHQLARELVFNFEYQGFWDWIHEVTPFDDIQLAYQNFQSDPNIENRMRLRLRLENLRNAQLEGEDTTMAWAWDAGAFIGWTPRGAKEFVRGVISREIYRPLSKELLLLDGEPAIEISRGLEIYAEMRELVHAFIRAGWQVWFISASPQVEVEIFAAYFGIHQSRILGMRRRVINGRFTLECEPPISFGDGKLDAYRRFISESEPPAFVAGDSLGDWKLLECATRIALLIEPLASTLREYGRWRRELGEKWLIQDFS